MNPGKRLDSGDADDQTTVDANALGPQSPAEALSEPDFGMAINTIRFDIQFQFLRPRRWRLAGILPIVRRDRIMPCVDGVPLTDLIDRFELEAGMRPAGGAYGGLIPAYCRHLPLDEHFHGRSTMATGSRTPVLVCECGEWACWPLLAEIVVTDDLVIWNCAEQPGRRARDYSAFGPFRFDRKQYDDALRDLGKPISSDSDAVEPPRSSR
ncbi:hypothetical protein ACWIGW_19395 [Nocardia brasiliensis]